MASLKDKFEARAQNMARPAASPVSEFPPLSPSSPSHDTLTQILVEQIERDPAQPRRDLGDLTDLKASIASVGVVQPIVVTILGYEHYRLVAGERRYTAAKELKLLKIPAIVRTVDETQRLEIQIVENLHRKDLNPFEEAEGYLRLMKECHLTQEEIGKRLGKTQVSVSELLRLTDLPRTIVEEYRTSDKISKSLLLEIAKSPQSEQLKLWEEAKKGDLTVRKAREKAAVEKKPRAKASQPTTFYHPIKTRGAVVTVAFKRQDASLQDVIVALEEALAAEKAKIPLMEVGDGLTVRR